MAEVEVKVEHAAEDAAEAPAAITEAAIDHAERLGQHGAMLAQHATTIGEHATSLQALREDLDRAHARLDDLAERAYSTVSPETVENVVDRVEDLENKVADEAIGAEESTQEAVVPEHHDSERPKQSIGSKLWSQMKRLV